MERWVGDLEADGLLDTATRVWCGVFKNVDTGEVRKFYFGNSDYITNMLHFMSSLPCLIIHNGLGFDWPLLEKLYGYVYKGKKIDTLVLSRLLNPKRMSPPNCPNKRAPHSIEAWGYRVGRGKPEHEDWSKFSEEMLHRCTEDTEILLLVYNALVKEAEQHGNWDMAIPLTMKLFELLQKQEQYGWLVDREHINKSIHLLDHWIKRIDRVLTPILPIIIEVQEGKEDGHYKFVSKPFKQNGDYTIHVTNWINSLGDDTPKDIVAGPFSRVYFRKVDLNSNEETKEYLLSQGWIPKEWNENDDGERTSAKLNKDDPFEGITSGVGKLVAKRVQCRQRKSILEGFIPLIRNDGRIPSVINNLAVTGRATHRNIVNIPGDKAFFGKHMRQCFVAAKGKVLVGTDSDACQIRMLCARMDDPSYTNTVLNGRKEDKTDIHSVNMRAINSQKEWIKHRDDAKTFFYGIIFGAGDAKTGRIIHGTAADGKALKESFFSGLSALGALVKRLTDEWRSNAKKRYNGKFGRIEYYDGWFTGLDGRPIFVPSEHMVLVYALQSDEAIMMAAAYCIFYKWACEKGWTYGKEYGIVCWYHDEYTVECDEDIAADVAKLTTKSIEWAGNFYKIKCPHTGQAKIGKNWYDIH